jgi:hypothetical protein
VLVRKDRKFTAASLRRMGEAGIEWIPIGVDDLMRPTPSSASRRSTSSTSPPAR